MVLSEGIAPPSPAGAVGITPGWRPRRGQVLISLPAPGKRSDPQQRNTARAASYFKIHLSKILSFFFFSHFFSFLGSSAKGLSISVFCASQRDGGQEGSWDPWHGKDRGLLGTSSSDLG